VNAYKVKGVQRVGLELERCHVPNVDIYRSGSKVTTTANDGAYTDNIGNKGGGSYTYRGVRGGDDLDLFGQR
jgi:hypothetical protein